MRGNVMALVVSASVLLIVLAAISGCSSAYDYRYETRGRGWPLGPVLEDADRKMLLLSLERELIRLGADVVARDTDRNVLLFRGPDELWRTEESASAPHGSVDDQAASNLWLDEDRTSRTHHGFADGKITLAWWDRDECWCLRLYVVMSAFRGDPLAADRDRFLRQVEEGLDTYIRRNVAEGPFLRVPGSGLP